MADSSNDPTIPSSDSLTAFLLREDCYVARISSALWTSSLEDGSGILASEIIKQYQISPEFADQVYQHISRVDVIPKDKVVSLPFPLATYSTSMMFKDVPGIDEKSLLMVHTKSDFPLIGLESVIKREAKAYMQQFRHEETQRLEQQQYYDGKINMMVQSNQEIARRMHEQREEQLSALKEQKQSDISFLVDHVKKLESKFTRETSWLREETSKLRLEAEEETKLRREADTRSSQFERQIQEIQVRAEQAKKDKIRQANLIADLQEKLRKSATAKDTLDSRLDREAEERKKVAATRIQEREEMAKRCSELETKLEMESNRVADLEVTLEGHDIYITFGDATALHLIRIRHLLNVIQGQLAKLCRLEYGNERGASSRSWRQFCNQLGEDKGTRVAGVTKKVRELGAETPAFQKLAQSGALRTLVNDFSLRDQGDKAAHPPGLITKNIHMYQNAIAKVISDKETMEELMGCIEFAISVFPSF